MPNGYSINDEFGSSSTVPTECPQNDGDTVLRPGNVSFLQTDGRDETTEVHWRDFSIVNSLVSMYVHEPYVLFYTDSPDIRFTDTNLVVYTSDII